MKPDSKTTSFYHSRPSKWLGGRKAVVPCANIWLYLLSSCQPPWLDLGSSSSGQRGPIDDKESESAKQLSDLLEGLHLALATIGGYINQPYHNTFNRR